MNNKKQRQRYSCDIRICTSHAAVAYENIRNQYEPRTQSRTYATQVLIHHIMQNAPGYVLFLQTDLNLLLVHE